MPAGYDPLNPQPYTPPEIPQQQAMPGTDPMPAKPSPFGGQPGYQFTQGPISHGGAIAGIADNVLRGIVNGHAQGEAYKALKLKKKSDDLNASYQADAQRLWQVAQQQYQTAGKVDPNSDEYKAAKSAVDGSWGALHDFRGQLLEQQGGGKKKGGKKQDDQKPPQAVLTDPNSSPEEKMKAIYAVSAKLGPPVYGQVAQFNTPRAQQAWHAQQQGAETDAAKAETEATMAKMQNRIAVLSAKDKLTPEEITELGDEQERYTKLRETLNPSKMTAGDRKRYSEDGKFTYMVDATGDEIAGTRHPVSATNTKPVRAWTKGKDGKFTSVLVDPLTNKTVPGSENSDLQPPASLSGSVTTGDYHWVDSNGDVHSTTETHTRTPLASAEGGGRSAATSPAAAPTTVTQSFKGKSVPGMIYPGNVDIANRPNIDNGDGTHSSVFSMSFGTDKGEVLVPGVGDGKTYPARKLTEQEAWDQYKKTGQNLGTFKTPKDADAYAKTLHEDQAKYGNAPTPNRRAKPERTATPPAASTATPPVIPQAPGVKGDRILGHKGSPAETKAQEQASTLATAYRSALQRLKDPTPIGDQAIVFDWVRSQIAGAGRMTNTEIQQAYKAGSLETRANNAMDRVFKGTLDPSFRRQMVNDIGVSARAARDEYQSYQPKNREQGGQPAKVKMKAPNGQTQDVPVDQVAYYKSIGAVEVKP
jgi:hypothetical protein